jgi:cellulose synthase/poly-beta-1,6-N-acetylglucosamine synthase-like glycosyltransferase
METAMNRPLLLAELICWFTVVVLLYTYLGYPFLVFVCGRLRSNRIRQSDITPAISIIIAAYNEERHLGAKLENTASLDYPEDKLEVIIISDCSTDRTDEIARAFPWSGVSVVRQCERRGKTAAQNRGVAEASGDILVFSDATTSYRSDALRKIVRSFADPSVGCVAGRLRYADPSLSGTGFGARAYWLYETFLRAQESRASTLVGVSGALYAVRRSAYATLHEEAHGDFLIAARMAELGLRTVLEPEAVCWEETNKCSTKELQMRVRVITQTLADLWRLRSLLNPARMGFYSVQLFSHKVLRYLVPLLYALNFAAVAILGFWSTLYALILYGHLILLVAGAGAWALERLGVNSGRWLTLPQYFLMVNVACLKAISDYARGKRIISWETERGATAD